MSAVKTSALCIVPPVGAWGAVQKWREQHDPQAFVWPPHMNILYPFVPEACFPDAAAKLTRVLQAHSELMISFKKLGSFGKVAFLEPECQSDPGLQRLYCSCVEAFPELKSQLRSSFKPHLTVGQFSTVAACKSFLNTCDKPDITVSVSNLCLLARDKVDLKNSPFRVSWYVMLDQAVAQEGPKRPYCLESPSSDFMQTKGAPAVVATAELDEEVKEVSAAPVLPKLLDDFLEKVGPEFDPTFVKVHIGTDDLDELLEFTWDKADLSPLVDAGLKPLLRNKLYRAILQEKVERANRGEDVVSRCLESAMVVNEALASPTATPSAASMCETGDNEDASSTMSVPTCSASEASQVPMLSQDGSVGEMSSDQPTMSMDSSTAFASSGELVTEESQSLDSGFQTSLSTPAVDAFPPLGAPSKSRSVPQAKHTTIATGTEKAWAYRADEREARRAARTEAGAARERVEQMQQATQQAAQLAANRGIYFTRQEQRTQRTLQRAPQSSSPEQARASQSAPRTPGYGRQFGLASAYQSNYSVGSFGCPRSCKICYPTG